MSPPPTAPPIFGPLDLGPSGLLGGGFGVHMSRRQPHIPPRSISPEFRPKWAKRAAYGGAFGGDLTKEKGHKFFWSQNFPLTRGPKSDLGETLEGGVGYVTPLYLSPLPMSGPVLDRPTGAKVPGLPRAIPVYHPPLYGTGPRPFDPPNLPYRGDGKIACVGLE